MNYNVYKGRPSHSKRLGFLGIFGRKFKRNHNYKYYDNVYLFRSGSFCDVDLSAKKNPVLEFLKKSKEELRNLQENVVIKSRKQVGVAVSILAILVALNSGSIKENYNGYVRSDEANIQDEINTLKDMKSSLEKIYYETNANVYRLSK